MHKLWEVAGGTIAGTEHRRLGRNAQDSYYSISDERATIAIVCDGCGSGQDSEVGAKIGARLVAETLRRSLPDDPNLSLANDFWEQVRNHVLMRLENLVLAMGTDKYCLDREIIQHYFLFTVVGTILTPKAATLFSIGDGVIIVNGLIQNLGTFANNAPPYLAYELLFPGAEQWKFQIQPPIAIESLDSILIGTDGVCDLIAAADQKIPGKNQLVGDIAQFWQRDAYFNNPDLIRRQLFLINREITKADWSNKQLFHQTGFLPDDTTFLVIRRCDRR
jgi:Protein phosphatase 2C